MLCNLERTGGRFSPGHGRTDTGARAGSEGRYNRGMRYLYVLCVLGLLVPLGIHAADVSVMEEIVAKVNGDIITSTELAEDRAAIEAQLKQKGVIGADLQQQVDQQMANDLRNRIDTFLLTQRAKEMDLKVEPDVNKAVASYMRQVNVSDPDQFQALVVKETGRPYADFVQQLRDQALQEAIIREEIMRKIAVTKEESQAYYDQHREEMKRQEQVFLREILVSTQGKTTPEELAAAEKKAQDLDARAKRGEAFAQMAQTNSDATTKDQGGLLPGYKKGELSENLEKLVWDAPRGFVTDPIKIDTGWLILKVEEHYQEGIPTYEEVEGQIQNQLYATRQEPALRAYLTKLREDAFLRIKDGYSDSGAAPGKITAWGTPALLRPETITREEVLANPSMKRLLGLFPIPGTQKTGASSSR